MVGAMDLSSVDQLVFESQIVRIGLFRCRPWQPWFEDTGPIHDHLIVFPRTSVRITHAGDQPIVADPNVVMFYNKGQRYRRGKLSERGDLCEWFAFHSAVIADVVRLYDEGSAEREGRPFALTHGPSDARCYLLQRLAVDHALCAGPPDHLYVEETLLYVLGQVIEKAYSARGIGSSVYAQNTQRAQVELANALKVLLATAFHERRSLTQLARDVHSSPFHLCRIFRCQTGWSIHRYLNQLRLRTALEYIAQGDTDLTTLGLNLGYSSHSHFTQAFHRTFGMSPSTLRRLASTRRLRELSKKLIV
jgi:AraC-like DNA-binding protein